MTIEFPENIYRAIGLRAYKLDTTKKEVVITAFKLTTLQESYTNQTIKEISSGLEKIIEDCKLRFTEEDLDRIILLEDECDGVTVVPIEVKLEEEEIILEELTPADLEEMERQRIAKWPS